MASSTLFDRPLPVGLTIRSAAAEREAFKGDRVGRGREGNVCLGWAREGRGPWTSSSEEGAGRRGILNANVLREVGSEFTGAEVIRYDVSDDKTWGEASITHAFRYASKMPPMKTEIYHLKIEV
ncbi:hypothetical protein SCHPADRAFT_891131 [Schizopora paradoxa]|uniref:Uncharacterized protein n=1 Tax=Schizopora paradoxa TaxID=27342 RepID=A0A0H2RRC6_9AGAM|nr:hypothetical protein SCHPADRAFT_891131 [Schizopora paradoxa]